MTMGSHAAVSGALPGGGRLLAPSAACPRRVGAPRSQALALRGPARRTSLPAGLPPWIAVSGLDFAYPFPNDCETRAPPRRKTRHMALTQSLTRFGLATVERKVGNVSSSANLASLSQRKLNALGLPLAYVDCDRRYRFVNKAFLEWTGKVFTDVIGQQVQRRHGTGRCSRCTRPTSRRRSPASATGFERQLQRARAGPPIWIHVDYYPDRGTDGDVRGFLVVLCQRRPAEAARARGRRPRASAASRHRQRRLADHPLRSQLKLRFANKPFGDWIGVAPDDLLGRRMQELIAGGTFADMDEHIDRAFSGAKVSFERRERKSTGELRWVRITLFPTARWAAASTASSPS